MEPGAVFALMGAGIWFFLHMAGRDQGPQHENRNMKPMPLPRSCSNDTATHEANHGAVALFYNGFVVELEIEPAGRASCFAPTDAYQAAMAAAGSLVSGRWEPGTRDYDLCSTYSARAGITIDDARNLARKALNDPACRRGRDRIAAALRKKKRLHGSEIKTIYLC